MANDPLYVGVDGGGSTCRVRVRDHEGALRAAVEGGNANVYLDFETAVRNIRDCVVEAATRAAAARGGPPALRLGLGLAGVSGPAMAERVRIALADLGAIVVTHDGDVACLGAHGGQDGGLIIAGTGSGGVARIAGRSLTIGGRGFVMGDDGSGARLGLEGLRRALRAHDGLEAGTALTARLMNHFGDNPVALIEWGRTARSSDFGAFGPVVLSAAQEGDAIGLSLVEAAAAAISDLAAALQHLGATRLAFVGGLSRPLRPFLPPAIAGTMTDPLFDALDGALLLAGCPLGAAPVTAE